MPTKPRNRSAFNEWFREQFGPRPTRRTIDSLLWEQADLRDRLRKVDQLLQRTERYDRDRNTSLLGWNGGYHERIHREGK